MRVRAPLLRAIIVWPLAFALIATACSSKKTTPTTQSRPFPTSTSHSTIVLQAVGVIDHLGMERAAKIMQTRLSRLGFPDSQVRVNRSRILINLPGRVPPVRAGQAAEASGLLQFYDLETSLAGPSVSSSGNPVQTTDLYRFLSKVQAEARSARPASYYVFTSRHAHFFGPAPTKSAALALGKKSHVPKGWGFLAVPHNTAVVTCDSTEVVCPGNTGQAGGNTVPPPAPGQSYYYLFIHDPNKKLVDDIKGVPQMTGSDLKLSGTRQDFDPTTNEPVVLMQFTGSGSHKFQKVTAEEYARGRNRQIPQHFAIVLDGEIRSFPQIDYTKSDLAGGISGNAEISGIKSIGEAKQLAVLLETGALPVRFIRVR